MIDLNMSAMSAFLKAQDIMQTLTIKNFHEAVDVALVASSDSSRHDYSEASKIAEIVTEKIDTSDWESALRKILEISILTFNYPWKSSFKLGRKYVLESLSINEKQVFRSAGLLEEDMSPEIIKWWNQIQLLLSPSEQNDDFRKWEYKSFLEEKEYLKSLGCSISPAWVAIDDNLLGFDILSFRQAGESWQEIYIEVKSSSTGLTRFFLSDREAEKLIFNKNSYFIHFWDTKKQEKKEFSGSEIIPHLPVNQGSGKWKSVMINLLD